MKPDFKVRLTQPKHSTPHEPDVSASDIRELEEELMPQIAELAENGSQTQRILVNRSRQAFRLHRAMALVMQELKKNG